MRIGRLLLVTLLGATRAAAQAPFGPEPDPATKTQILELREAAWRTWFANDTAGFVRVVPDELIAMGWDGGPWENRSQAIAAMASFAAGGLKLTKLEFPRNVFQQYGDVIILYTAFRLEMAGSTGEPQRLSGRGSEVFVRRKGRWIHTAWHLDNVGF